MASLEAELAAIEAGLADPALYVDGVGRSEALTRRQHALRTELEAAEEALLALYG